MTDAANITPTIRTAITQLGFGHSIRFVVNGRPQQRGSKQAVLIPKRGGGFVEKNGRPIVAAKDDNPNSKEWMGQVRDAAHAAYAGELLNGPVRLTVAFYFKRPKSHFRTGRNSSLLRDDAPRWHAGTPDLDKLIRAIGDSLTGVILHDDKQIAAFGADTCKLWTTEAERAAVTITPLGTP